jgi:hypothetical protein
MKRRYLIMSALFLGSLFTTGAIAQTPKPTTAFQPKTDDEKAIVTMIADHEKRYPKPAIVTRLVVSASYGLYSWVVGETGGQTVVKKETNGSWAIVRGTGGQLGVGILQRWGVPEAIAQDLIEKMAAQIKADR